MARTANPKNVKLSTIKNPVTGEFYTEYFVDIMKMANQAEEAWPNLAKAFALKEESEKTKASAETEKREANRKRKQDRVDAIIKKLDLKMPEGLKISSCEVKAKGPKVDVLGEDGKPETDSNGKLTGRKVQSVTHYDIDLRWGGRGEATLLRKSVSCGGTKTPKSEDVLEKEIDEVTEELMSMLLKVLA